MSIQAAVTHFGAGGGWLRAIAPDDADWRLALGRLAAGLALAGGATGLLVTLRRSRRGPRER